MSSSAQPYVMYICSYMRISYGCVEAMRGRHLQCIPPSRTASFHSVPIQISIAAVLLPVHRRCNKRRPAYVLGMRTEQVQLIVNIVLTRERRIERRESSHSYWLVRAWTAICSEIPLPIHSNYLLYVPYVTRYFWPPSMPC